MLYQPQAWAHFLVNLEMAIFIWLKQTRLIKLYLKRSFFCVPKQHKQTFMHFVIDFKEFVDMTLATAMWERKYVFPLSLVSLWVLSEFPCMWAVHVACVSGCVCVRCVSLSFCLCMVHYWMQWTGQCQRRTPSGHAGWQRRDQSCCQKAFLTHCCSPIGDISGAFDCKESPQRSDKHNSPKLPLKHH